MVAHFYLKTLLPLQAFSMKPSSETTLTSTKIKTLFKTLIHTQFHCLSKAFSKAKSVAIQIYKQSKPAVYFISSKSSKKNHKHKKLFFGSFRLHYNWCSSHVMPVPAPVLEGCYYDSNWNSVISTDQCKGEDDIVESELSGYLQWLEEKKVNGNSGADNYQTDMNEIDKLAEMFIATCHEKFRLEKQESYRRFQEMLARSM